MKTLKWVGIILGILILGGYISFEYMKNQTKRASPEETTEYKQGDKLLSVFYCRPYTKGRDIFGSLVPYGEVWRTGANEATTFTTNTTIDFGGEIVQPGSYTLWTIPQETQWTIILNSKMYGWGVGLDGAPSREAEYDVVKINVPVQTLDELVKQFTIAFVYNVNMNLSWEKTKVSVPIKFQPSKSTAL